MQSYLEEESDDEHLQGTHADNQANLHHAEVDDPLLRAPHRTEVTVLACPEVLLVPRDGRQLSRHLEDRLLQYCCLLRGAALLRG